MRLSELTEGLPLEKKAGSEDPEITSICIDSRRVRDGSLFVAREGWYVDGHQFIDAAIQSGAAAVVVSRADRAPRNALVPIVVGPHEDPFVGWLSARFYGEPTRQLKVIGVTGTNGKTSVAFMATQMLRSLGYRTALLSTVHYDCAGVLEPAPNTTPDALVIQRFAHRALRAGCTHLVMEVSSHGIKLERIAETHFDAVGFTNLSHDHLDFHPSFEDYRDTKFSLFGPRRSVLSDGSETALAAVVCVDDPAGSELARSVDEQRLVCVSSRPVSDVPAGIRVLSAEPDNTVTLSVAGRQLAAASPLVGAYNRANLGVALGLVRAVTNTEVEGLAEHLPTVSGAPGRMEPVGRSAPELPSVFVDYAHTPDAVDNALSTLRDVTRGRLISVVGCGGDRDRTKRSAMTSAAVQHSDVVLVTADNPRSESLDDIFRDMLPEGVPDDVHVVADRRDAVFRAVAMARADDTVAVLGKGHEDYQEVRGQRTHFDDREEARRALAFRLYPGVFADERAVPILSGLSPAQLAHVVGGELVREAASRPVRLLQTDSRAVVPGDLFMALRGERFDAHDFVVDVVRSGASVAVVEEGRVDVDSLPAGASIITVRDGREAMASLASGLLSIRRKQAGAFRTIGITGSNGKTSAKEMTRAILSSVEGARVLATPGNFNNEVGLPLTVAGLSPAHSAAVLEMGANAKGDIRGLVETARPEVVVITSIAAAHTAGFGGIEGVRRAKSEVFRYGTPQLAILPVDEASSGWTEECAKLGVEVLTFGREGSGADLEAGRATPLGPVALVGHGVAEALSGGLELGPPGIHQATNFAAAALAALAAPETPLVSSDAAILEQGARHVELPGGRWRTVQWGSAMLIDDAYNANPASIAASLEVLSSFPEPRIAVLGELRELSDDMDEVQRIHREVGQLAAAFVDVVIGVGEMGRPLSDGAGEKGHHAPTDDAAAQLVRDLAARGGSVLLKASRGARLERVLELVATQPQEH